MRTSAVLLALPFVLLSCDGSSGFRECKEEEEVFVFVDRDGDGFGVEPLGYTCAVGENEALNSLDCNDDDPTVSPGAPELCDGIDNNCDDRPDEGLQRLTYFLDADGDGFGDPETAVTTCDNPGDEYVRDANDCDDENEDRFPGNLEICNNFIDEDCTGIADDIPEICNDNIDNDCDDLVDCGDEECSSSPTCLQACANEGLPSEENLTATGSFVGQSNNWTLEDGLNCIDLPLDDVDVALQYIPPVPGEYRIFVPNPGMFPVSMAILEEGCTDTTFDDCDQSIAGSPGVEIMAESVGGETWIILLDRIFPVITDWEIEIERIP